MDTLTSQERLVWFTVFSEPNMAHLAYAQVYIPAEGELLKAAFEYLDRVVL